MMSEYRAAAVAAVVWCESGDGRNKYGEVTDIARLLHDGYRIATDKDSSSCSRKRPERHHLSGTPDVGASIVSASCTRWESAQPT